MPAEVTIDLQRVPRTAAALWMRLRPALVLIASRCVAVPLQMVSQVAVGALAGPAGLGVLQLFTSWTCFAGEMLAQGLPARAMKISAIAHQQGDLATASAELRRSRRLIVRLWLLVLAIGGISGAVWFVSSWLASGDGAHITIALGALLAAPLFALQRLWSESLKGANRAQAAVSIENLTLPLVLLTGTGIVWLSGLSPEGYAPILPGIGLAGFLLAALMLRGVMKRHLKGSSPEDLPATWPRAKGDQAALWGGSVLAVVFLQAPFLVLPWFSEVAEIGVYAVAFRLVGLVTMLLLLQAAVFGPAFARAASRGEPAALRGLLRRTQLLSSVTFAFGVMPLLLLSESLAGLFNVPAEGLRAYLVILAAGQFFNAITGLSGVMLNMAGQARVEVKTLLGAVLVTLIFAPLVGSHFGAEGIAWLFSLSLAGKNVASWIAAEHFLIQLENRYESA